MTKLLEIARRVTEIRWTPHNAAHSEQWGIAERDRWIKLDEALMELAEEVRNAGSPVNHQSKPESEVGTGSKQPIWGVGVRVPSNVYEGGRPVCECDHPEDAARIVAALNATTAPVPPTGKPALSDGAATLSEPSSAGELETALASIDWQQVVRNGGPPCFHIEEGRFCLRAERWHRHGVSAIHEFMPLAGLIRRQLAEEKRAHEVTIDQRDIAEEAADKLAYALYDIEEIGEHSNINDPWENACNLMAEDQVEHARYKAACEQIVALDFTKTARGGDDFYSGPDRFITAWNLAQAALAAGAKSSVQCLVLPTNGDSGPQGQPDLPSMGTFECPRCTYRVRAPINTEATCPDCQAMFSTVIEESQ